VKLICVDLEDTLPDIAPCAEGDQWVLVRLHLHPLGYVYPPREGCDASTLARTISQRLGWSIARHLVADRLGDSAPFAEGALVRDADGHAIRLVRGTPAGRATN